MPKPTERDLAMEDLEERRSRAVESMFTPHPDYIRVIRCRDCAVPHNIWTGCPKMNGTIMPPHGYCYYGVPKDGMTSRGEGEK